MLIKLALALGLSTFIGSNTEVFECEVVPLDDYGFVQLGEHPEYVCVNPDNDADFIIIEDEALLGEDQLNIGDGMKVELNEHGEVLNQYRVKSLNSLLEVMDIEE